MAMNRIINNADLVVEDMLKGWLLAHADTVVGTDNSRVVKRARRRFRTRTCISGLCGRRDG